jgi:hypothetical protein
MTHDKDPREEALCLSRRIWTLVQRKGDRSKNGLQPRGLLEAGR